jgi:hypothetical protein
MITELSPWESLSPSHPAHVAGPMAVACTQPNPRLAIIHTPAQHGRGRA